VLGSDGSVYVTGYSWGGDSTKWDYATVKYNSSGQQQWVRRYNGTGNAEDWASGIAIDKLNNIYVTGKSKGVGTDYDYLTIKYSPSGDSLWTARYNGPANGVDEAVAVWVDPEGNVIVTGRSVGSGTNYDYTTVKYNTSGAQLWAARYNGPGNGVDEPSALAVDDSGNVYVTGRSIGSGTNFDYATVKYDANGNQVWASRYNGADNGVDEASALTLDGKGNAIVTGRSYSAATNFDYLTIKYNASGDTLWTRHFNERGVSVDNTGPLFSGVTAVRSAGPFAARLDWAPAIDDQARSDEIVYDIYRATAPGGENFGSPTYTTAPGATSFLVTALSPDTTYYFVVRARDQQGNRDRNSVEKLVNTAMLTIEEVNQATGIHWQMQAQGGGDQPFSFDGVSLAQAFTQIFSASSTSFLILGMVTFANLEEAKQRLSKFMQTEPPVNSEALILSGADFSVYSKDEFGNSLVLCQRGKTIVAIGPVGISVSKEVLVSLAQLVSQRAGTLALSVSSSERATVGSSTALEQNSVPLAVSAPSFPRQPHQHGDYTHNLELKSVQLGDEDGDDALFRGCGDIWIAVQITETQADGPINVGEVTNTAFFAGQDKLCENALWEVNANLYIHQAPERPHPGNTINVLIKDSDENNGDILAAVSQIAKVAATAAGKDNVAKAIGASVETIKLVVGEQEKQSVTAYDKIDKMTGDELGRGTNNVTWPHGTGTFRINFKYGSVKEVVYEGPYAEKVD